MAFFRLPQSLKKKYAKEAKAGERGTSHGRGLLLEGLEVDRVGKSSDLCHGGTLPKPCGAQAGLSSGQQDTAVWSGWTSSPQS